MYHKVVSVVLAVLVFIVGYVVMQNRELRGELNELKSEIQEVKKATEAKIASPEAQSPFDKPNNDPLAPLYEPNAETKTSIKFEKMKHDFGRIKEGEHVKTKFKFTNTGKVALIISGAQGSCGCTVPQWPQTPVKPGETGEIDVEFDSSGKSGQTTKTVTVGANTEPASTILTITATIIPRDK